MDRLDKDLYADWESGSDYPPDTTHLGMVTRCWPVDRTICFLECEGNWCLGVSLGCGYDFSPALLLTAEPRIQGNWQLWDLDDCAPAIYELLEYADRAPLKPIVPSRAALRNLLCRYHRDYVRAVRQLSPSRPPIRRGPALRMARRFLKLTYKMPHNNSPFCSINLIDFGNCRIMAYQEALDKLRRAPSNERPLLTRELQEAAAWGREAAPDYFGPQLPPERTPLGHPSRCFHLSAGIWLLECRGRWLLTAAFPESYFISSAAKARAILKTEPGVRFFWPMETCAPVVYELLSTSHHYGLQELITSMEDLEDVLCRHYPAYVERTNREKQEAHEMKARLCRARGESGPYDLPKLARPAPRPAQGFWEADCLPPGAPLSFKPDDEA